MKSLGDFGKEAVNLVTAIGEHIPFIGPVFVAFNAVKKYVE